jgi:adenine-specific DNA-methyltransferase
MMNITLSSTYTPSDILLSQSDSLEFLKSTPSDLATLIVTSPPYNIGKPYEQRTELGKYLDWQQEILTECIRILKPNGSICWQTGNYISDREVYPLDIFFYQILRERLGLKLRNRIIWKFGHGLHCTYRFSGRYETILWFTKTDDYIFNLDSIRVPQKYPGKKYFDGAKAGQLSGNPLGKNPSDIWDVLVEDWENEVWDIPNVKSNHPEKTTHPCQYPIELVERLVLALTNEGDIVLDPFMGVGSSLIVAVLHNRKAIGIDKEKEYVDLAKIRILQALDGTLKRRKLGTQVYDSSKSNLSKVPKEWM